MGGKTLKELRSLEDFTADMKEAGFSKPGDIVWEKQNRALPGNAGYKLMGTFNYKDADGQSVPVYLHIEGDEHKSVPEKEHCFCPSIDDKPDTKSCVTYLGESCERTGTPASMSGWVTRPS